MSCVYNTYVNDMQVYSISKSIINHGARNSVKYLEQFFFQYLTGTTYSRIEARLSLLLYVYQYLCINKLLLICTFTVDVFISIYFCILISAIRH